MRDIKKVLCCLLLSTCCMHAEVCIIDTIKAVVASPFGTEIITQSDIDRPTLSGEMRTFDALLFEKALLLDAKKHQIVADDDMVSAYIKQIQHDNNITSEQVADLFTSGGYTYEEGFEQMRNMQSINTMLQMKVSAEVTIARREVEAFYHQNPVYTNETFTLQRTVVPFAKDITTEEQKNILQDRIKRRKRAGFVWSNPFTINADDIAIDKQFIRTMNVQDISMPKAVTGGFELFHLIKKEEKRLLSLDERYIDIVQTLQKPKYQSVLNTYKNEVVEKVFVVRL